MATQRVILAVEIDAVEGFLHRVFFKRGAEVSGDLVGCRETNFVAEGNEGINQFGYAVFGISAVMPRAGLCRVERWIQQRAAG